MNARSGSPVAAPAGPSRGGKIHLRGYTLEDPIRNRLTELGYTLLFGARGADLVLVAPGLDASRLLQAQKAAAEAGNVPILDATAFFHSLAVAEVAAEDDAAAPVAARATRSAWSGRGGRGSGTDGVDHSEGSVRILDVTLPVRADAPHPHAPPASTFTHLCFDAEFLHTARTVALAARHGLPAAFEGETATSKTTAIAWVAHLVGTPLYRVNLHGHSDAGELVGRYVPAAGGGWRFAEGVVPRAMREGAWVVLDEANLAEPQVLERLNAVLENPPTLVLSEGEGTRFGPTGDVPVHPDFRVFLTMNPAEYAGRSPLSPAFRDRFPLWTFVRSPDEAALRAMLDALVFGTHPEVALNGSLWRSDPTLPVHGALAALPDVRDRLEAIARFHSTVSRATGQEAAATLGRTRRERYTCTRRTLLAALQMWATESAAIPPDESGPFNAEAHATLLHDVLRRTYVARMQDDAERQAVLAALRAAGLGEPTAFRGAA